MAAPVRIRRIVPADAQALRAFYAGLSVDSRRLRFLSAGTVVDEGLLRDFCGSDHEHREGLVAVADAPGGEERIVGHLCLEPTAPGELEIAIAIADDYQRLGVGTALVDEAASWARSHSTRSLHAWCAIDNVGIRRLLAHLHQPMSNALMGEGSAEITVDMTAANAPDADGDLAA